MSILTISQAIKNAQASGFAGDSVNMIVAIQMSESGLNTKPKDNINSDGSRDRGLNQINSYWHSEVTDKCAYDASCSTIAAYKISKQGTDFTPWSTYRTSSYYTNLSQTTLLNGTIPSPIAVSQVMTIPEWCKPLVSMSQAQAESTLNHFPTSSEGWYEGGVDFTPTIPGTPVTSLLDGVVVGAGYFCKNPANYFATDYRTCGGSTIGYGVVTIRSTNPFPNLVSGKQIDIYYQHMIIDSSIRLSNTGGSGQKVKAGQKIGVSNPSFNLEIGVNIGKEWGGIWGTSSPGPHVDPIPILFAIINDTSPRTDNSSLTTAIDAVSAIDTIHETLNNVPGFLGICEALDIAEQFTPFKLPATTNNPNPVGTVFNDITGLSSLKELKTFSDVITLPSETIQAALVFLVDNTRASVFRGTLILLGLVICVALIINLINPEETAKTATKIIGGMV